MRVGIYVRISRDIAGEGLGVQRQLEDCEGLAKQLGWEIADRYIDNDVSATSGKTRPDYQRLLKDLRSGDIGAIIAWHPDRLYRRAIDLGELVDVCKETNAQVATVNAGNVDLTTPTGRLVAGLLAQVAMYEVEHKSERWSRSWQQGRERGAPVTNSNRLFGYERDGMTVVEEEAIIARRMVSDLLAGASQHSVLRWLQAEDITTTKGLPWRAAGLKYYLRNPRIAGWSTHKGEIVAKGEWPALIDPDEWKQVTELLSARTRDYIPRKNLLPGLIFCGICGMRLISGTQRGKRIYRCPTRPNMDGCGRTSGLVEPIEGIVEGYAQARIEMPEVRQRIAELRTHPSGQQNELAALDARIIELEHQLDEPGTPVATIMRAIERAKGRQEEILAALVAAPRASLPVQGGPWPEDLARRRALIDLVVARVELNPSGGRGAPKFKAERLVITPH